MHEKLKYVQREKLMRVHPDVRESNPFATPPAGPAGARRRLPAGSAPIEGYRVSPTLIARVCRGDWNPDRHPADRGHRDALAARGYWQAYRAVRESVRRATAGEPPGRRGGGRPSDLVPGAVRAERRRRPRPPARDPAVRRRRGRHRLIGTRFGNRG